MPFFQPTHEVTDEEKGAAEEAMKAARMSKYTVLYGKVNDHSGHQDSPLLGDGQQV